MNYSLFRSSTFWTIILMFIVGGVNAIANVIPGVWDAVIMAVLTALASTFHLQTAQAAGAVN